MIALVSVIANVNACYWMRKIDGKMKISGTTMRRKRKRKRKRKRMCDRMRM
jgi:hypothetical protein